MTREEKIAVLAELDGWTPYSPGDFNPTPRWINEVHTVRTLDELRCYLTSYDAIIPLVKQQPNTVIGEVFDRCNVIFATPEQLADALIKAVGKWRE